MASEFEKLYKQITPARHRKPEKLAKKITGEDRKESVVKPIALRLPYDLRNELLELAEERNQTLSNVVLEALRYALGKPPYVQK